MCPTTGCTTEWKEAALKMFNTNSDAVISSSEFNNGCLTLLADWNPPSDQEICISEWSKVSPNGSSVTTTSNLLMTYLTSECPTAGCTDEWIEAALKMFDTDTNDAFINPNEFNVGCLALLEGWSPPSDQEICNTEWTKVSPNGSSVPTNSIMTYLDSMCPTSGCTAEWLEAALKMFNSDTNAVISPLEFNIGCLALLDGWNPPTV